MPTPARRMSSLPLSGSFLAIQIVQAAVKPSATVTELITLCQNDPSFVSRVVAYVNSAGFGLSRQVTGVQHAISLLGIRGTRNLALAMCVVDMTPQGPHGDALLAVCLRRGVTAKLLAEKLGRSNVDDYFTLGLLLEVGLLVKARNALEAAADFARSPAHTRVMLERAGGQEDHAKLGGRLARSWQLGEETANAILDHHNRLTPSSPLGSAAWLVEQLAGVYESADVPESRVKAIEAASTLDLPGSTVDEILKAIPPALTEAARQFGRELGPQVGLDTLLRDTKGALNELNKSYAETVNKLESLLKEREQLAAALKAADEKLATLALTDSLTGLPNHRAFREALVRDLARADRARAPLSLIVLDVDHFAQINQSYGNTAADMVLRAIAEVVQQAVRTSDVPARIGGEKFALILPNTNLQGAMVVAERARTQLLQRKFAAGSGEFAVSASLGIAVTTGPGCRGREDALLVAAESGLQMAKQAGRNRFMVGSL
jgi:two-component system, cell cycle response regulator